MGLFRHWFMYAGCSIQDVRPLWITAGWRDSHCSLWSEVVVCTVWGSVILPHTGANCTSDCLAHGWVHSSELPLIDFTFGCQLGFCCCCSFLMYDMPFFLTCYCGVILKDTIRYLSLHDNKYIRYFPGHNKRWGVDLFSSVIVLYLDLIELKVAVF